jgi:serine/threonine protein kinase/tetratricopeptide (TPR) repeat protein
MNQEQWQRVKELVDQVILTDPAERPAFLDAACGREGELRREVESLLAAHEQAGTNFLKEPAVDFNFAVSASAARARSRIGAYQIIDQLGRGGMGEVYRAARADGQYDKQVAIKLVRVGLDTAFLLERFRHERQILASLDHPNIARLLDGGTTESGTPYLVMELVEGVPIDQYCNERKLSVTQQLQLFLQVCGAVQYAHQRLVIHRDLKPGNVLVTKEGVPKLLDFGIAKILDQSGDTLTTVAQSMTPEYASPEQIRGETITTASDVYSLGIVLYQLLTGCSPYGINTSTPRGWSRAILEAEPLRPSHVVLKPKAVPPGDNKINLESRSYAGEGSPAKLRRRLLGDIDNILLMALRKEPQRRYASVEQFAEDIRRHLTGLPVMAAKDSWSYRTGKFVRRHRAGIIAAGLALVALIVGVGLILREARIARAERERADQRFNDVRKLAHSLIFELHDSITDLPGSTPARKLLVSRALEYLDSLAGQAKGDTSLQKELATAYERVGDVLGNAYFANLGDTAGALQSYRKALAIREQLARANPDDMQLQGALARNYIRVANVLGATGDFSGALETVRKALPITERMAASNNEPATADSLAGTYYFTARLLGQTGDPAGALENYRKASSIREAALQADPTNVSFNSHLAGDFEGMAHSMMQMGNLAQAIQMQTKAVATLEPISSASANNATVREFLAEATNRLGTLRQENGDLSKALEAHRKAHQMFLELLKADPKNLLATSNFGFSDNGIGDSLNALGQQTSALASFREAINTFESMSPGTSGNRYRRTGLANSYSGMGNAFSALAANPHTSATKAREDWQAARSWYEKSESLWTDKKNRGELESDERADLDAVAKAIAKCDSALGVPNLTGAR